MELCLHARSSLPVAVAGQACAVLFAQPGSRNLSSCDSQQAVEAADHRLCRVGSRVEDRVTQCAPELGPASRLAHSSERACQQTAGRRAYLHAGHGGRAQPGRAGYLNGGLDVMQSPGTRHSPLFTSVKPPPPPDQAEDAKSRRAIVYSVVRARTLLLRDGRLGYDLHGPPPLQASLWPAGSSGSP